MSARPPPAHLSRSFVARLKTYEEHIEGWLDHLFELDYVEWVLINTNIGVR